MNRPAMRTAMALYESGTLNLGTAANQAGVSTDRLRRAVRRTGGSPPPVTVESDRVPLRAD